MMNSNAVEMCLLAESLLLCEHGLSGRTCAVTLGGLR